ncbi:carbohydrate ABC transporter permease [Halobellus marinus]|uniref:carbohydrate ABC transporter permease n=1 Tax=Halobellus TaxID=1073986 RepID=UPI0028B18403|nr:carbohydrate ABC transporter permease [Halobellus sp. DFY28]
MSTTSSSQTLAQRVLPRIHRVLLYAFAAVFVFAFGFPIYWMMVSSITPLEQVISYPPSFVPLEMTFENYERLLSDTSFAQWMFNSLVVSFGNIALSITVSILAGYGLTRFHLPYKKHLAYIFLFAYMFAPVMLGVPYFMIFHQYGLLNTYPGIILAHSSVTIPFTIWLMWQFFQTVPIELEESAWIYGAPRWKSMLEVAIPSAAPGIVAAAIFAFGISWSDYTFALILISDPSMQMMTVGIANFTTGAEIFWDLIMASITLLVIPPLLIIFFLNKYILKGFSVSGM